MALRHALAEQLNLPPNESVNIVVGKDILLDIDDLPHDRCQSVYVVRCNRAVAGLARAGVAYRRNEWGAWSDALSSAEAATETSTSTEDPQL